MTNPDIVKLTNTQSRLIEDNRRRYEKAVEDAQGQLQRFSDQRESARQAIIGFFQCLEAGELEAGIEMLRLEMETWKE